MLDFEKMANGGLARIKPYQAGKPIEEVKRELGLDDVIKLASNENPFGMSKKAVEAAKKAIDEGNFYPDSNGFYLKHALHVKFGYDMKRITLGAGSNELINLLFEAFVNKDVNVVLPDYSFCVYGMEATINGAQVKSVPLNDWKVDLNKVLAAIDSDTRIVAFANPSNPIGTAIPSADMKSFLKKVPENTLVVIDEAYNEFNSGDKTYEDSARWLNSYPNLVISRTFSKAYGLAGLRVGYMLSDPGIVSVLDRLRAPFNVNAVAQAAAIAALDDDEFIKKTVDNNTKERARYMEFFKAQGVKAIDSKANFVAADFAPHDAQKLAAELLKRGVIVRPLLGYKLRDILRISIGTPEQNDRFFKETAELLKTL